MEKQGSFDYILLETTGLADPGNLAPLFWVDEGLGSTIYLDGIVTLVDAKNILQSLDQPGASLTDHSNEGLSSGPVSDTQGHEHSGPELSVAHLQISHADVVVMNKSDLVSPQQLQMVQQRIVAINGLTRIHATEHSRVPQLEGVLLDLHAYDQVDAASIDFASKGHSHLDPAISTIALTLAPISEHQLSKLDAWLRALLWDGLFLKHPDAEDGAKSAGDRTDIHRIKGRLPTVDGRLKLLQGVREVFEFVDAMDTVAESGAAGESRGKIIMIGRNIGGEEGQMRMQKSLDQAIHAR